MEGTIFRFDDRFINMFLQTRFPGKLDGKHTIIRLVEGDDELDEKKQAENAIQRQFKVIGKEMFIEDEVVIKWLKLNKDFGTLITIHDPAAENKAKVAELKKGLDTIIKITKMGNADLLQLGILKYGSKEALRQVADGDYEGLRIELAGEAQQDPEEMERLMDKNENQNLTFAAVAFAANIVKEDDSSTNVKWVSNDAHIVSVATGLRPVDALASFFETTEGNKVKQEIGIAMETKQLNEGTAKSHGRTSAQK